MKESIITYFCCPKCGGELIAESSLSDHGEIKEGGLICANCNASFPIRNYIPRFVSDENYAASFGFEWNRHARTQIDKFSGTTISKERFFKVTNWSNEMKDQLILEAGCGAGRFTQVALDTGAQIFSFDYSNSVDANLQNNEITEKLHIFQASIYDIPLKHEAFDRVFCFGVLQHTPDVKKAFMSLLPYLKDGGEIVIDVYNRPWYNPIIPRYIVRWLFGPLIRKMKPDTLYEIVSKIVPVLLPVKIFLRKIPLIGRYGSFLIPVANLKGVLPLTKEQLLEWGTLDTFDMLSPRYDTPQRLNNVKDWLVEAGLTDIEVKYGPNGINARGIKPVTTSSH
ncbi:methyltransferase domain-containing protein [Chloroflexota bacterium]